MTKHDSHVCSIIIQQPTSFNSHHDQKNLTSHNKYMLSMYTCIYNKCKHLLPDSWIVLAVVCFVKYRWINTIPQCNLLSLVVVYYTNAKQPHALNICITNLLCIIFKEITEVFVVLIVCTSYPKQRLIKWDYISVLLRKYLLSTGLLMSVMWRPCYYENLNCRWLITFQGSLCPFWTYIFMSQ